MNKFNRNNLLSLFVLFATIFSASSCTDGMEEKLKPVPTAYGTLNQVVVVADEDLWGSSVGDTFQYYFASPYLILPQPEPVFDLVHFTPLEMREKPLRKELRTILFLANISDTESPTAKIVREDVGQEKINEARESGKAYSIVGRDKWAKDQLIIYLFATNNAALTDGIRKSFPAAREKINQVDAKRVEATVYQGGEHRKVMDKIMEKFSLSMKMPKDYFIARDEENTLWIRKETEDLSSNILMTVRNYTDQGQLTEEGIIALRDSLGKQLISSQAPNSYMITNQEDLPVFLERKTTAGHYTLVAKGIWEMENDYMGGPFVSYAILNENKSKILFVDGFVFAPGEEKRDYMIFLEAIINTLQW